MEEKDFRAPVRGSGAAAPLVRSREQAAAKAAQPPVQPSSRPKDSLDKYMEKNLDFDGLAEDIKTMITNRVQESVPDDRRIMLDLVAQVGELTEEVRQLRKQLDSKPYAVFTCPNGQLKDMTSELAEIKELLADSDSQRHDISSLMLEPIITPPPASSIPHTPPVTPQPQTAPIVTPPPVAPAPPGPEQAAPVQPQQPAPEVVQPTPAPAAAQKKGKEKKKKNFLSVFGNILFYTVVIGIVVGAFLVKSGSGGQPTMIAGYSAFTVLTSSMEDTYPKGSLIITRSVDADELEVGDDITYMISESSSVTHRIIGITENYLNTGERAFETQGTMNEKPDKDPVAAANVVGKVIFCSEGLGQAATFVSANWPILLFGMAVLGGLYAFLRWNFRREEEPAGRHSQKRRH